MRDSDYPEFVQALTVAVEALAQEFSAERIEAYWLALRDMRLDVVRCGLTRVIGEWQPTFHESFPFPKTLRELALGGHRTGAPPPLPVGQPQAALPPPQSDAGPGRRAFRDVLAQLEGRMAARSATLREIGEEG